MGAGIAPQMAEAFGCDNFPLEQIYYTEYTEDGLDYQVETHNKGDINKLGQIDYKNIIIDTRRGKRLSGYQPPKPNFLLELIVVNAYTQYDYNARTKPFDYEAFILCMKKINHIFKGKHIGLPQIGAGLAGGSWSAIEQIILNRLKDMDVTIVKYKP
jgi:hypothetical protein